MSHGFGFKYLNSLLIFEILKTVSSKIQPFIRLLSFHFPIALAKIWSKEHFTAILLQK